MQTQVNQQVHFDNTFPSFNAGSSSVILTVKNSAADNTAVVYVNTSATLNVTLTNQTGADIALSAGDQLEVYMPTYFTAGEVNGMNISGISQSGWTFTQDPTDTSLLLSWGNTAGTWAAGASLTFNINTVVSASEPASDFVQVNFNSITGNNVPAQVTASLTLMAPVVVGNADLHTTLQVGLEFDGAIYTSTPDNALVDSLTLTIKNTGANPLYNGKQAWSGNPRVIIRFVYGNTSGALAPGDKTGHSSQGSAWNISGSISDDEGNSWSAGNPDPTGGDAWPSWTFSPSQSNEGIIGTGADANVMFQFNDIFSFTPSGATQMYVLFTGFAQDENTNYNDALFICDINKLPPPSTQGLQKFYSAPSMYAYTTAQGSANGTTHINLFWTCFEVASVQLEYDITGVQPAPPSPFSKTYDGINPVVRDSLVLTLPSVIVGNQVNFTMYAYDSGGDVLGSLPFTVTVEQQADAYTFTGPADPVTYNLNQAAAFTLAWTAFNAASVKITSSFAGISACQRNYSTPEVWTTDSVVINVSGLTGSVTIPFTLEAFDRNGTLLNSMTLSVSCVVTGWCDPKDSKVYSVITLNNQLWLAENYDYNIWANQQPAPRDRPDGMFYNDDPSYEVPYGMYYEYTTALSIAPDGWRLPTDADWQGLFAIYGTNANGRYMPGGDTGLNLQAGGACSEETLNFAGLGVEGLYWSQASDPTQCGMVSLLDGQISVGDAPIVNFFSLASVRYVRNS